MKNNLQIFLLTLTLIVVLTLTACGQGAASVTPSPDTQSASAEATPTAAASDSDAPTESAEPDGSTAPLELEKLTFVLDWTPNTNHTGVYAAVAKGYFAEEGLEVDIIQPGDSMADTLVAANTAQFGISYQESVTFARASSVPLVSLAAVIQHNSSGFASYQEKGISAVKDFEGKKYGGWGSDMESATIKYLMDQAGADFSKVEILTTGSTDFFQGSETDQIDFAWIFEGWAGIEAQLKGIELNYIDLGKEAEVFDYYTPVIVTNEGMLKDKADTVSRFMKAVCKGYTFAINNPDEAAEILLTAAPELNRELVVESQKFLSSRYQADAAYWGEQQETVWVRYMKWLYENGFIETEPDMTKAYTNEFLTKSE